MFAGIVTRASQDDPRRYTTAQTLINALTPFDQADVTGEWSSEHAIIVQALTWNTAESKHETTPEVCAETKRVIAAWVRLDNRAALCAELNLENTETLTDPQLILAAHGSWGEGCVDKLEGDFSFVIFDPGLHTVLCAKDSVGARPLFYYLDKEVFIFATTAAVFTVLETLRFLPTQEWAVRQMLWYRSDPTKTAFDGVYKLSPAHYLLVGRGGDSGPKRYFEFDGESPVADNRDEKWLIAYRQAFHRAVDDRARSKYLVGAESSGGLDSSGIVARAAVSVWHGVADMHCFGFCEYNKEPEYILKTAYHCGIRNSHVFVRNKWQLDSEVYDRGAAVLGYPPEHGIAYVHQPFYEICFDKGIRTLYSGYGGDEVVTSKAVLFARELYVNRQFGALLRELPGNPFERAVRLALMILRGGKQRKSRSLTSHLSTLPTLLLKDGVADEFGLRDYELQHTEAWERGNTVNEGILKYPIFSQGQSNRLDACSLIANSYKVDMRWPLLERRLMQQYLHTPAIEKDHRGIGRYLHRRAVDGSIPDSITWKTKTMGGNPQWSLKAEQPLTHDWESLPPLMRDVIDPQKLKKNITAVTEFEPSTKKEDKMLHLQRRKMLLDLEIACSWLSKR